MSNRDRKAGVSVTSGIAIGSTGRTYGPDGGVETDEFGNTFVTGSRVHLGEVVRGSRSSEGLARDTRARLKKSAFRHFSDDDSERDASLLEDAGLPADCILQTFLAKGRVTLDSGTYVLMEEDGEPVTVDERYVYRPVQVSKKELAARRVIVGSGIAVEGSITGGVVTIGSGNIIGGKRRKR